MYDFKQKNVFMYKLYFFKDILILIATAVIVVNISGLLSSDVVSGFNKLNTPIIIGLSLISIIYLAPKLSKQLDKFYMRNFPTGKVVYLSSWEFQFLTLPYATLPFIEPPQNITFFALYFMLVLQVSAHIYLVIKYFKNSKKTILKSDTVDRLNRTKFIESICSELTGSKSQKILWIDAPWGDGKTWIVNEIKKELSKNEKSIVIKYDPWLYVYDNNPEKIIINFYKKLTAELKDHYNIGDLDSSISKFIKNVSNTSQKKILGDVIFAEDDTDINDLSESIKDFLQRNSIKLYVLIDELDRLNPREVECVLRLTRGLSLVEGNNLHIVISACKNIVANNLENNKISRKYLEKISQDIRHLPYIDIDTFEAELINEVDKIIDLIDLKDKVKRAIKDYFKGDFFTLANVNIALPNLRRKDVVFSYLKDYYDQESPNESILQELDLDDLIALIMLRGVNEEAYKLIRNSKNEILGFYWKHPSEDEKNQAEKKRYIKRLLAEVFRQTNSNIKENTFIEWSIHKLFPTLEKGGTPKSNKSIENVEYFHRYFSDSWNNYLLSAFRCTKIIELLNSGECILSEKCRRIWGSTEKLEWLLYKFKREFNDSLNENAKINLSKLLIKTLKNEWKYKHQGEPAQITDFRTYKWNSDEGVLDTLRSDAYNTHLFALIDFANKVYWDHIRNRNERVDFDYLVKASNYAVNKFESLFDKDPKGLINQGESFDEIAYNFNYYWNVLQRLDIVQDTKAIVHADHEKVVSPFRSKIFKTLKSDLENSFDNICMYLLTYCESPIKERDINGKAVFRVDWQWMGYPKFNTILHYNEEIEFLFKTYIKQVNYIGNFGSSEWNQYQRKNPKRRGFIESSLGRFYDYISERDDLKDDMAVWDKEARKKEG